MSMTNEQTCELDLRDARAQIDRLEARLREADELLRCAHYAHQRLGLEGGGNRGYPHEVRIFAMHFSEAEEPKTPRRTILAGDGRFWRYWRDRHTDEQSGESK